MMPTVEPHKVFEKRPSELAIRFAFGGGITVVTHLIANAWGPVVAGLFLAFPALLPASLTLIRRHDGPTEAAEDARGALAGCVALAVFAAVVWWGFGGDRSPAVVLFTAAAAWFAVAVALWRLFLA
jgi:hypothetical protein